MPERTITVRLNAITSSYKAAMADAATSTSMFGARVNAMATAGQKHSQAFTLMGAAAAGAGLAIAAGLGVAGKAAIDFESSFAGVAKTVDASASELEAMSGELRDMAKQIPVSVNELNRIAESAGALGVSKGDVVGFTRVIAELAITTDLTADAAANGMARIRNAFTLTIPQVDQLSDVLVDLGNKGASTEPEILDIATNLAGAGKVAGFTAPGLLAVAAAIANVGENAEAGSSSMSKLVLEMLAATELGGSKLQGFARVAGQSAGEFARAFKERPEQAVVSFVAGLERIRNEGGSVVATLDDLGLSEIRVRRLLLNLSTNSAQFAQTLRDSDEAAKNNNARTLEAEKRYETFASKLQVTKNRLEDAKISAGQFVLQGGEPLLDIAGSLANAFGELPRSLQATAVGLGALASGGLLVAGAALLILPRLSAMIEGFGLLRSAVRNAGGGLVLLARGIPIAGALAGVGLLMHMIARAQAAADRFATRTAARGADTEAQIAAVRKEMEKQQAIADSVGRLDIGGATFFFDVGDIKGSERAKKAQNRADALGRIEEQLTTQQVAEAAIRKQAAADEAKAQEFAHAQMQGSIAATGDAFAALTEEQQKAIEKAREAALDMTTSFDRIEVNAEHTLRSFRESTNANSELLAKFTADLKKIAEIDPGLAELFRREGPDAALAASEAAKAIVSGKGLGGMPAEVQKVVQNAKAFADLEFAGWQANFAGQGAAAGRAGREGVEAELRPLDGLEVNPKVNIQVNDGGLFATKRLLDTLPSTKTITVKTVGIPQTVTSPSGDATQKHQGGLVGRYHGGGLISAARMHGGGLASDEVLTVLQRKEFVVNADDTGRNLGLLQAINAGRMHDGGRVGPLPVVPGSGRASTSPTLDAVGGLRNDIRALARAVADRPVTLQVDGHVFGETVSRSLRDRKRERS